MIKDSSFRDEDEEDEYQEALEDDLKGPFFECEDDDDRKYDRLTAGDVKAILNIDKKFEADSLEEACEDDAEEAQKEWEDDLEDNTLQLKKWVFIGDPYNMENLEEALEDAGAEVKKVEAIQVCEEE